MSGFRVNRDLGHISWVRGRKCRWILASLKRYAQKIRDSPLLIKRNPPEDSRSENRSNAIDHSERKGRPARNSVVFQRI
jgi:hypothetical protein